MSRRRFLGAGACAPVLLVLAACVTQPGSSVVTPMSSGTFSSSYAGALPHTVTYRGVGLTLEPPGEVTPAVSPQDASHACSSGEAVCYDKPATTVLALATTTQSGTANNDGSITPLLKATPVYATTWANIRCLPAGGPPQPAPTPPVEASDCTAVSLVDALSGKFVFGFVGQNP